MDKKIVAFPGRLSSWKGQESFIKLILNCSDFSGLIVGPYKNAKKKYFNRLNRLIEITTSEIEFSMMRKDIKRFIIYLI